MKIYRITREWYWGTRFTRKYSSVFVKAPDKSKALRKFNSYLKRGHEEALKLNGIPLPERQRDLPSWFSVREIEILY